MSAKTTPVGERNDGPRGQCRRDRQNRRNEEQVAARARRQHDLLEDQLEYVRKRLEQPERPHAVRTDPHLHPADHLALGQREVGDGQDQRDRDGDDLGERPHRGPRGAEEAGDWG